MDIGYYVGLTIKWLRAYFADNWIFLLLTVVAFIYLYATCRELRHKFLWPIAVMMLIVINPILYKYVFSQVIYWRLFWMLPGAILMAMAMVMLLRKIKIIWVKYVLLFLSVAFIIVIGENVFSHGGFEERRNWEKLSEETINVCDILLEYDASPKAVIHSEICAEVRQYAPKIEMMYGREAFMPGYIRNAREMEYSVYTSLKEEPVNFDYALQMAAEYGYNFFVISAQTPVPDECLNDYGYEELGRTEEHIIYYNSEIR